MAKIMRALVVLLIALVAAWSVAQAAGLGSMQHDMSGMMAHDEQTANTAQCQDCGSSSTTDEANGLCQIACVSPALADLTASVAPASVMPVSPLHVPPRAADLRGRTDPPDPFPPRPFLT